MMLCGRVTARGPAVGAAALAQVVQGIQARHELHISAAVKSTPSTLPSSARCVVVGGGIAGVSTAYHLALEGWTDTIVLERDKLTSGTTWHAAGLVGRIGGSPRITRMRAYGASLYNELEETTGMSSGYTINGGITIATDKFRLDLIREWISRANAQGVVAMEIGPEETQERCPLLNTKDVIASLWSPYDGQINPVDCTMMMAEATRNLGVTIREDTPVTMIKTDDSGIRGVMTKEGFIECEFVCLAGGMWSKQLAADVGASVPLWPCEHEYVLTDAIDGIKGMPVVRTYDESLYLKEDAGRLLVGLFEPNAKPAFRDVPRVPENFSFGSFPDDLEHLTPYLENAMHRVPALQTIPITSYFTGPESFTPDGVEMLGQCPEVSRLFVCTGFNSHGIVCGPAAGKYVADWIIEGTNGRKVDLLAMDIARFQPWQSKLEYIRPVAAESLGKQYNRTYPHQQRKYGRNMILSPIHDALCGHGAVFGIAGGYERPLWYEPENMAMSSEKRLNVNGDQDYIRHVKNECMACREKAVIFDLSSFSKFLVEGHDAAAQLQQICAANIDRGIGRTIYTLVLNEQGGIETACVVAKIGADKFLITCGSGERSKMKYWLEQSLKSPGSYLKDVTGDYAIIALTGPTSTRLMQEACGDSSWKSLDFGHGKWMDVCGHRAWIQRLSYAGELGFEIYASKEDATSIHHNIVDAANVHDENVGNLDKIGLAHAGSLAQNILRLEKGFVHYGHDVGPDMTPSEAGMSYAVSLKKKFDFVGKRVHLADREKETKSKRALYSVEGISSPDQLFPIDSPIYAGTSVVGIVASGAYSFYYNTGLIMAHVDHESQENQLEVELGNRRFDLKLIRKGSLHDPDGERMRAKICSTRSTIGG